MDTSQKNTDEKFMSRCLQLAANGIQGARPNPMVGAVIVADRRIIGEGYHVRCGEGHAEVNAFASVRSEDEPLLPESTIYVSLEPCSHYGKTPPCADLIISKAVKRVVVGCIDPFAKVPVAEPTLLHLPLETPPVHHPEVGTDGQWFH